MQDLTVAVAQMCSTEHFSENFAQIKKHLTKAIEQQVDLLLFPENMACFAASKAQDLAQFGLQHEVIVYLQHVAKQQQMTIVIGSFPTRNPGSDKPFTTCIVIGCDGEITAQYHKIHLFSATVNDSQGRYDEAATFSAGKQIVCAQTEHANLGLSICYDLRFPELYQALRRQGAEILVVPSAFTYLTGKAHWLPLLQARAIETGCYVMAANQGGEHSATRRTWGHSVIISPWGEVLAQAEEAPCLLVQRLQQSELLNARSAIPVWHNKVL